MRSCLILPAFINEIHHKCTEDKENEQGNKHVVNGPDVINFKQLTAEKKGKMSICTPALKTKLCTVTNLYYNIPQSCLNHIYMTSTSSVNLL